MIIAHLSLVVVILLALPISFTARAQAWIPAVSAPATAPETTPSSAEGGAAQASPKKAEGATVKADASG
ncbi:MAG: hypothetical protein SH809_15705 [Rhodothermales bacterium]|nr:hypothetical protein [Rhodothermales bacterium]